MEYSWIYSVVTVVIIVLSDSSTACIYGSAEDCASQCHCENDAVCDAITGQCPGQCAPGFPQLENRENEFDWRGHSCQTGNVAYGKPAAQSGAFGKLWANYSVEGLVGNSGNNHCAHPQADTGQNAWLRVDLGSPHVVINVTVFNTKDGGGWQRLTNFTISVGNTTNESDHTECASHVSPPVPAGSDMTLACSSPLTGRFVSFRRIGGNQTHLVTICELVVMGYKQLQNACNNCAGNCDDLMGCSVCSPGFTNLPLCDQGCAINTYGDDCDKQCGSCRDAATCDHTDGSCPGGCQQWYTGDTCHQFIRVHNIDPNKNPTSATVINSTAVNISWIQDADVWANMSEFYGYKIKYNIKDTSNQIMSEDIAHTGEGGVYIVIGGLKSGTTYQFQVFIYRRQNDQTEISIWSSNMVEETTAEENVFSTTSRILTPTEMTVTETPPLTTAFTSTIASLKTSQTEGSTATDSTSTTQSTSSPVVTSSVSATAEVQTTSYGLPSSTSSLPPSTSSLPSLTSSLQSSTSSTLLPSSPMPSSSTSSPIPDSSTSTPVFTRSPHASTTEDVPPPSTATPGAGVHEMNHMTIIGIAVGCGVAFILVIILIVVVIKCRRSDEEKPIAKRSIDVIIESGKPMSAVNDGFVDDEPPAMVTEHDHDSNTLIPVTGLPAHISKLKSTKNGFKNEFSDLPKEDFATFHIGNLPENYKKNRFANIRPYDTNRVVLTVEEEGESDYINASHVNAFAKEDRKYIATQGPKEHMIPDLWRMIWQQGVNRIVMVTALVEMGVKKCEPYWPQGIGKSKTYGKIVITTVAENEYADHAYRLLDVTEGEDGETRQVHQFHFLSWIDKNRPDDAFSLLEFRRKVRSFDHLAQGPLLVHCSAGVGRTGTFMALDCLLDQAASEQRVDVFSCVYHLRTKRMNMVQTLNQYIFLHEALEEGIECGVTAIPCAEFDEQYNAIKKDTGDGLTKLQQQFELLARLKPSPGDDADDDSYDDDGESGNPTRAGFLPQNKDKNRTSKVIPSDKHRPMLIRQSVDASDYINAIFLNTYNQSKSLLLTQMPLPATVGDFWRLVHQQQCHQVVMLNTCEKDDENCEPYWPSETEMRAHYGQIEIELTETDTTQHPDIIIRHINVVLCNDSEDEDLMKVTHYQLTSWPNHNSLPPQPSHLLDVMQMLDKGSHGDSKDKMLLQCMDGAERSGWFAAAKYMVDKLKLEQEVDVFLACRHVTSRRPEAIPNVEQYRALYDLARTYMYDFGQYANFKR